MWSGACPVTLDDGRAVRALGYIVDRRHPQYAGRLPEAELLRLVRQGTWHFRRDPDYVRSTHEHLLPWTWSIRRSRHS
jgi:cation transport protein ChaC